MKVKMTRDDVNAGRLIPNGEYIGEITAATDETSSGGNDMLVLDLKVQNHPEFSGVEIRDWLGNWFRGADKMRRFIEAISAAKYDYEKEYDLSDAKLKGKRVKFYNRQGTDQTGNPCNQVQDYKNVDAK